MSDTASQSTTKPMLAIPAPVTGQRLAFADLPSPFLRAGVWGQGAAFVFTGNVLHAPVDSVIETMPETGYEVTLRTRRGLRLLIKLGFGTERLMGEKCERHCRAGQVVRAATPLMHIQPAWLKRQKIETVGTVNVLNIKQCKDFIEGHGKQVLAMEDTLFTVYL